MDSAQGVLYALHNIVVCRVAARADGVVWFVQSAGMIAAGHSLGGALATLAAFDIRRHLMDNMQSNAEVVCYTFAAPRTGNHAFAREYNAMVPDTWSVINDQVSLRLCLVSTPSHQPSDQSRASVKHHYSALERRLRLYSLGVCKFCVINA